MTTTYKTKHGYYCEECNMPTIGDWTKHHTGLILCGYCYQLWKDDEPVKAEIDLSEFHHKLHTAIEDCDQKRKLTIPEMANHTVWVELSYTRKYEDE